MTPQARSLLELGDGPADPETVRRAYLRRVRVVRLEVDPDGFTRLREAFESLIAGAAAPAAEVTATRDALAAQPDSAETRWRLLSYLPYATGPEALPILCHGAERQPDEFRDELLFHFPGKVPAGLLAAARNGAAFGRSLLIADVHATQGRPADALEVLRAALSAGDLHSPALQRLAMRSVFSLHAHLQLDAAGEGLALVKQRMGTLAPDARNVDPETATIFQIADELGRLGASFPLDLRQVAAAAAKRGNVSNAAYEARFATRLMKPHELRDLNELLKREAPTLAGVLGLALTEDQLRPAGTPNVRIPIGWASFLLMTVLLGSYQIHRINRYRQKRRPMKDLVQSVNADLVRNLTSDIDQACVDPESERCRYYRTLFSNGGQSDAGTTSKREGSDPYPELTGGPVGTDGGMRLEDLPIIGRPHEPDSRSHRAKR